MFTGIVFGTYPVTRVIEREDLLSFRIDVPQELLFDIAIGASVAIDGVCLTVTRFTDTSIDFDVMQQTLRTTTLAHLREGGMVNVERSHRPGMEVGGHIVSGHVDGMARVVRVDTPANNFVLTVQLPREWMKYVFPKGFLALNGVSLTIAEVNKTESTLTVYLIPETLRRTTFGQKQVGDSVNFEVERQTQAIVDTVVDVLGSLIKNEQLSFAEIQNLQQSIISPTEKGVET